MAVILKDLGPVSAYAVAVAHGYTGTEAEWEQLIADSANNAQTAVSSAASAHLSAEQAAQNATLAIDAKDEALNAQTAAEASASAAETSEAQAAIYAGQAASAKTAAETAQGKAEDAADEAQAVADSIPQDYTTLNNDVGNLKNQLNDTTGAKIIQINTVYDGTPSNPSNANWICFAGSYYAGRRADRISVKAGDAIDVTVLKKVSTVDHYIFTIALYSDTVTDNTIYVRGDSPYATKESFLPFTVTQDGYVGIGIGARDSSDNVVALRANQFSVNDFVVSIVTDSAKNTAEQNKRAIAAHDSILKIERILPLGVYQGSVTNPNNPNAVCTGGEYTVAMRNARIPVIPGKKIDVQVLPKLPEGYHYSFGYLFAKDNTSDADIRQGGYYSYTTHDYYFPLIVPDGYTYFAVTVAAYDSDGNELTLSPVAYYGDKIQIIQEDYDASRDETVLWQNQKSLTPNVIETPDLMNGTINNSGNANFVVMKEILPTNGADAILVTVDDSVIQYGLATVGALFSKYTAGQSSRTATNRMRNHDPLPVYMRKDVSKTAFVFYTYGAEAFAVGLTDRDSEGTTTHALRVADVGNCIHIIRLYENKHGNESALESAIHYLKNARHMDYETLGVTPLTFLHFSDIHGDNTALFEIMNELRKYGDLVDETICTGDIVSNSYGAIDSWWNPSFLTCIGNHDSASYSSGTYNWTYLSMEERDNLYIKPFEMNWDAEHTEGTSYYYKDYSNSKLRLIVLDAMLYIGDSTTAEAQVQTAWLSGLLTSAITAGLHVLIAIHAPRQGAIPVECSFTQIGTTPYPATADCNTPAVVVEAVATAIEGGLHFVGYICGHTHWDAIYKATEDGSQLMFCVASANVNNRNQWKNKDQFHDVVLNIYNLVTVDTGNTLIKIVRGGGSTIDRLMRPRRAICFNYTTGQIVGEDA